MSLDQAPPVSADQGAPTPRRRRPLLGLVAALAAGGVLLGALAWQRGWFSRPTTSPLSKKGPSKVEEETEPDVERYPEGVLDFVEAHGATAQELGDWLEKKVRHEGLRPVFLSARSGPVARYCAIAVKDHKGLEWHMRHDMTEAEGWDHFNELEGAWRLVVNCRHFEKGALRESTIWLKGQASTPVGVGTLAAIKKAIQEHREEGFRPIYLSAALRPTGGKEVSATFGRADDLGWETYFNRTPDEMRKLVAQQSARGWRPDHVYVCPDGKGGKHYLTILVENKDKLDWLYRQDLTTKQYEAELVRQKKLGLRPVAVSGFGFGSNTRYAAIWVRYRDASPAKK